VIIADPMIIKATSEAQEPRDASCALTGELGTPALQFATGHTSNWQYDIYCPFRQCRAYGGTIAGPSTPLDPATKQPLH
jgi:hypothetical protein